MKSFILGKVDELVSDFLYYDRKNDEELPSGAIQAAIDSGDISNSEIVDRFSEALTKGLAG